MQTSDTDIQSTFCQFAYTEINTPKIVLYITKELRHVLLSNDQWKSSEQRLHNLPLTRLLGWVELNWIQRTNFLRFKDDYNIEAVVQEKQLSDNTVRLTTFNWVYCLNSVIFPRRQFCLKM